MSAFAINPPVYLRGRPERVIRSTRSAAELLRGLALQLDDPTTADLVARLEAVSNPAESEAVGREFRAWLGRRNLLLADAG